MTEKRLARETGPALKVAQQAEPIAETLGYRLVRVKMLGSVLQIMAERSDGSFSIEDCAILSRTLSPVLEQLDPISGRYYLEVSSPGIDRPLVRASDFENWAGFDAKIDMREAQAGRKKFRGCLEGYSEGEVRLFIEPAAGGKEPVLIGLPFDAINEAHLVLTDALIEAARLRRSEGHYADGSDWDDEITQSIDENGSKEHE